MTRKVTIKDIAKEAGVSVSLVSFVMNNRVQDNGKRKYRVSKETREKILQVAKRMGYRPNPFARSLRGGQIHAIGAVFPDIANPFYGELAREMENIAFNKGYTLMTGSMDEDAGKFDGVVRSFIEKRVDGFVVVPVIGSLPTLQHIAESGIPYVILDRDDFDVPVPKIVIDNEEAMRKAVDIVSQEVSADSVEMVSYDLRIGTILSREKGFCNAISGKGVENAAEKIVRIPYNDIHNGIIQAMPQILSRGTRGIVFATNTLTVSALSALVAKGVKVQEDVFITGFDNSDVYDVFRPYIPHIQQPIREICQRALSVLFDMIEDRKEPSDEKIVLESKVVIP